MDRGVGTPTKSSIWPRVDRGESEALPIDGELITWQAWNNVSVTSYRHVAVNEFELVVALNQYINNDNLLQTSPICPYKIFCNVMPCSTYEISIIYKNKSTVRISCEQV